MSFFKTTPFEAILGWRYTRQQRVRSNGFIGFISAVSVMGIALGVAALIVVLSVMNGFQKDVTMRMLSIVPHIEIYTPDNSEIPDVNFTINQILENKNVVGAAPFIGEQALLTNGEEMQGAMIRGIDPAAEVNVTPLAERLKDNLLKELKAGEFNILLGADLARRLNLYEGDKVTLLTPSGQITPAGTIPRLKQMTVAGIFNSGHYEYDSALALMNIEDAMKILKLEAPSGIRLKLTDMYKANEVAHELAGQIIGSFLILDWTKQNSTWFAAVKIEKVMMSIILTLIVAVAAFNLVSTLVMTVQDKRADIAILRTLGASPASIMAVFMIKGALVGVLGTFAGLFIGLLISFNIDVIVPFLENLFNASFLPKDIYLINKMPSDPRASDIIPISIISLILAFAATIYPSWRASRVNPAEALRYE